MSLDPNDIWRPYEPPLQPPEPPRRARRDHRKSRNGCGACKRRRVRCDEKLPIW